MPPPLTIDWQPRTGGFLVRIAGVLSESLNPKSLAEGLHGTVVFDLDGLNRCTSFGVREWMRALAQIRADYVAFINCRPSILAQFNMVAGFAGPGEIVSLYAPYLCPSCDHVTDRHFDLRRAYGDIAGEDLPHVPCERCGTDAEFDDLPDEYFAYVRSRPPPDVPPVAQAIIDGTEPAAAARLRVQKEVHGQVTVIRMSGPLDDRLRPKRGFEGLEGHVVLDMAGVQSADRAGIKRFLDWLGSLETPRFFHIHLRAPVLEQLSIGLAATEFPARHYVLSLLATTRCPSCRKDVDVEVQHDQLQALREASVPKASCPSCHRRLDLPVGASARSSLRQLVAVPPEQVKAYLAGRLERSGQRARTVPPGGGAGLPATDPSSRYEVVRRLASGGMAEIFLARRRGPQGFEKEVVLKRLLPNLTVDKEFLEMFVQEARLAARISHANVAQIFDLGQDAHGFFIAMEYVSGWDLRRVLLHNCRKGHPIPVDIACRIAADTCAGLHAAHTTSGPDGQNLRIVHRDVSPHNILLSDDGAVKLSDFGIAKVGHSMVHTRPGTMKGKAAYMAPEQVRGVETEIGPGSDIFSVGIVLFETLACRPLFFRESESATLYAVLNAPIPPIAGVRRDVPPELSAILDRALARDTAVRYGSAHDMRMALEDMMTARGMSVTSARLAAWLSETMLDEPRPANEPQLLNLDIEVTPPHPKGRS